MAEQEACTAAVSEALAAGAEVEVDTASDESKSPDAPADTEAARGESLLLPLLQGLLGGGGERLLAGLGAAGADVVADVRRSLARLRAALAPPAAHPQARALLALADRLEDALDAADRLDGCKRRPRRRSRAARHTVGVTQEELEEARRLVDRDQLSLSARPRDPPPTPPSSRKASAASSSASHDDSPALDDERTQDTVEKISHHDVVPVRKKVAPVSHSASYENQTHITRNAQIVERRAPAPKKPDFYRHSIPDTLPSHEETEPRQVTLVQREPYRPSNQRNGIAAIANKFNAQVEKETPPVRRLPRQAPMKAPMHTPIVVKSSQQTREEVRQVPLYRPPPPGFNFAAPPSAEEPVPARTARRIRMKRANTIDVGRALAQHRLDSDGEDDSLRRGPHVPEFHPQTENDKKFLAFMQRNEANRNTQPNGHTNWSDRFGNIKNAFENKDQRSQENSLIPSRSYWQNTDEPIRQAKKMFVDNVAERGRPKVPWAKDFPSTPDHRDHVWTSSDRREPLWSPERQTLRAPVQVQAPPTPPHPIREQPPPTLPPSPTRHDLAKPFITKPIPVNKFSHAPMSAFKPPKKIMSPTGTSPHIWSPPSHGQPSPTQDIPVHRLDGPTLPSPPPAMPLPPPSAPWVAERDRPRRVLGLAANKFENHDSPRSAPMPYSNTQRSSLNTFPPTPPFYSSYNGHEQDNRQNVAYPRNHRPFQPQRPPPPPEIERYRQSPGYPVKIIPSQHDLTAPELVKRIDGMKVTPDEVDFPPKIDAQRSQIQFYEKQIREKQAPYPLTNGHTNISKEFSTRLDPQPTYTVTNFTPANVVSTFVPLQSTPDIEKARAHKVDYLPDVVMNEGAPNESRQVNYNKRALPISAQAPHLQNGHAADDEGEATEHCSVVTRVMRGPVCGAATITAGVRTRTDSAPNAARPHPRDSLKGALDKVYPRRAQVRPVASHPAPAPTPPSIACTSPLSPPASFGSRSPGTPASRDSGMSREAGSRGPSPGGVQRSESWHRVPEPTIVRRAPAPTPASTSPRRIVSRAKSMHLLNVPKLYEGGISRDELTDKRKTVEAYFSGSSQKTVKTSTSSRSRSPGGSGRTQAGRGATQAFGLGRSRTMPSVTALQFLDESNADDAFEDLVSALA